MFYTGKRIRYFNSEAVVLSVSNSEVLLYIDGKHVKWVELSLLDDELPTTA